MASMDSGIAGSGGVPGPNAPLSPDPGFQVEETVETLRTM
jgi:hypothetical protein